MAVGNQFSIEDRDSLVDQNNLFKINYYKKSENMYNSENVLEGRKKKRYDFIGKQRFVSTPLSFSGGVGAGTLPKSNAGKYEGAVITAKRVYATCEIEREAIYASKGDKGAFVQATKETVKKTVESYMRNGSRIMFGDGSGVLGRGDGATNVTGAGTESNPYIVTISEASWLEANFEERDYVQVVDAMNAHPDNSAGSPEGGSTETNLLEIIEVDPAARQVHLNGTSAILAAHAGVAPGAGVTPLAATQGLCMQKSFGVEPQGLKGIRDASVAPVSPSNTLYNIPVQRRWKAIVKDANLEGITADAINGLMLDVKKATGKSPKMLMVGFEQYQNILALLEDQKVYNLPNKNLKGHMGFEGLEWVGAGGQKIGIFIDRFAQLDTMYALNDDRIECHHRPGFGWFDDDGTVFLRLQNDDAYGARYGGYYENFIIPTGQGYLENLAV
jgi:hypothetical protein